MTGFLGFLVIVASICMFGARFIKVKKRTADGMVSKQLWKAPFWMCTLTGVAGLILMLFNGMFFYAQPGYQYHVRTIWGQEIRVDGLGYKVKGFGEIEPWKNGYTVMAQKSANGNGEEAVVSYTIHPEGITFLDQVDAVVTATVRVSMPHDDDAFFKLVHDFRTQANFIRTSVVPAFRIAIDATGSMMTAEDYFSGGKTSFQDLFLDQMANGIYIVKRYEEVITLEEPEEITANASLAVQKVKANNTKTVFKVERLTNPDGTDRKKVHNFLSFGVTVNDAMITNCKPNDEFMARMKLKQKASADRAIAKEQRIQEEEQRLLAIAKGDREVAQTEAKWKSDQKEKTTIAETTKQLAITHANKIKEEASISEQTSIILLRKAEVDANNVKVTADADAYAREKKLKSDNGLKMKVDALVLMNRDNAEAFARRNVPTHVIYSGGGSGDDGLGGDSNVNNILNTQLLKNIKALDIDMNVAPKQ